MYIDAYYYVVWQGKSVHAEIPVFPYRASLYLDHGKLPQAFPTCTALETVVAPDSAYDQEMFQKCSSTRRPLLS